MERADARETRLNGKWNKDIKNLKFKNRIKWGAILLLFTLYVGQVIYTNYQLSKPTYRPYVVEISGGEIDFRGVVQEQELTVNDAIIRNYLMRFVKNIRSVSSDPVVLKESLKDAYFIASSQCQTELTELILSDNPFDLQESDITVDLKFTFYERLTENTWRVQWDEYYRRDGILQEIVVMAGTFTYFLRYPETEELAEINPFGLYFSDFYIDKART